MLRPSLLLSYLIIALALALTTITTTLPHILTLRTTPNPPCTCLDLTHPCCTPPSPSSENKIENIQPFCNLLGVTCCGDSFCVEGETCRGGSVCCTMGIACITTNGLVPAYAKQSSSSTSPSLNTNPSIPIASRNTSPSAHASITTTPTTTTITIAVRVVSVSGHAILSFPPPSPSQITSNGNGKPTAGVDVEVEVVTIYVLLYPSGTSGSAGAQVQMNLDVNTSTALPWTIISGSRHGSSPNSDFAEGGNGTTIPALTSTTKAKNATALPATNARLRSTSSTSPSASIPTPASTSPSPSASASPSTTITPTATSHHLCFNTLLQSPSPCPSTSNTLPTTSSHSLANRNGLPSAVRYVVAASVWALWVVLRWFGRGKLGARDGGESEVGVKGGRGVEGGDGVKIYGGEEEEKLQEGGGMGQWCVNRDADECGNGRGKCDGAEEEGNRDGDGEGGGRISRASTLHPHTNTSNTPQLKPDPKPEQDSSPEQLIEQPIDGKLKTLRLVCASVRGAPPSTKIGAGRFGNAGGTGHRDRLAVAGAGVEMRERGDGNVVTRRAIMEGYVNIPIPAPVGYETGRKWKEGEAKLVDVKEVEER